MKKILFFCFLGVFALFSCKHNLTSDYSDGKTSTFSGRNTADKLDDIVCEKSFNSLTFFSDSYFCLYVAKISEYDQKIWDNKMFYSNPSMKNFEEWSPYGFAKSAPASDGRYYVFIRGEGNSVVSASRFDPAIQSSNVETLENAVIFNPIYNCIKACLYEDACIYENEQNKKGDRVFSSALDFASKTHNTVSMHCFGNIETLLDWNTVKNGKHPFCNVGGFAGLFMTSNLKTPPLLVTTNLQRAQFACIFDSSDIVCVPSLTYDEKIYSQRWDGMYAAFRDCPGVEFVSATDYPDAYRYVIPHSNQSRLHYTLETFATYKNLKVPYSIDDIATTSRVLDYDLSSKSANTASLKEVIESSGIESLKIVDYELLCYPSEIDSTWLTFKSEKPFSICFSYNDGFVSRGVLAPNNMYYGYMATRKSTDFDKAEINYVTADIYSNQRCIVMKKCDGSVMRARRSESDGLYYISLKNRSADFLKGDKLKQASRFSYYEKHNDKHHSATIEIDGSNVDACGNLLGLLGYFICPSDNSMSITAIDDEAFSHLFFGQSALRTAPEIFGKDGGMIKPGVKCLYKMFSGCTNLKTLPKIYYTNPKTSAFESMFEDAKIADQGFRNKFHVKTGTNSNESRIFANMFKGANLNWPCTFENELFGEYLCQDMFLYCRLDQWPDLSNLKWYYNNGTGSLYKLLGSIFNNCGLNIHPTQINYYKYQIVFKNPYDSTVSALPINDIFGGYPSLVQSIDARTGILYYTDKPTVNLHEDLSQAREYIPFVKDYLLSFYSKNPFSISFGPNMPEGICKGAITLADETVSIDGSYISLEEWNGGEASAVWSDIDKLYHISLGGDARKALGGNTLNIKGRDVYAYGDCMALLDWRSLYSDTDRINEAPDNAFKNLFKSQNALVSPPNLCVKKLGISACESMYEGCKNLKNLPKIEYKEPTSFTFRYTFKDAKFADGGLKNRFVLRNYGGYYGMFMNSNIKYAPEIVDRSLHLTLEGPALCYMFSGCKELQELFSTHVVYLLDYDSNTGSTKHPFYCMYENSGIIPNFYSSWEDITGTFYEFSFGTGRSVDEMKELKGIFGEDGPSFIADMHYYTFIPVHCMIGQYMDDCITFTCSEKFYVKLTYKEGWRYGSELSSNDPKPWNGKVYKKMESGDVEWDGKTYLYSEWDSVCKRYKLTLYGKGNTRFSSASAATGLKFMPADGKWNSRVKINGNLNTLLDKSGGEISDMADMAFAGLFSDNKDCLEILEGFRLPQKKLSSNCYKLMFSGCGDLKRMPNLPSTQLAKNCYEKMFASCTFSQIDNTGVRVLPALTLKEGCYSNMFDGCTFTKSPISKIEATNLANFCCSAMFANCKNLKTIPVDFLPSKNLADSCYFGMFWGCKNLTIAPDLPATSLKKDCYRCMFRDCSNLVSIPPLPAKTLVTGCYSSMFDGCSRIKASYTDNLNNHYYSLFSTTLPSTNKKYLTVKAEGWFSVAYDLSPVYNMFNTDSKFTKTIKASAVKGGVRVDEYLTKYSSPNVNISASNGVVVRGAKILYREPSVNINIAGL